MDVGKALLDLLVVLSAAKVAVEIAERVHVPAVVAEIVAGVVVGPFLGIVGEDDVLRVLAELGVILLMLQVGLEMDIADLRSVGRPALGVATIGVGLPLAGGTAVALAAGHPGRVALFVGGALTATSVGITARVFGDLRALAMVEARTVLAAAVADDVLGLVLLTVVVRLAAEGSISFAAVGGVVVTAALFLVAATGAATRVAPPLLTRLERGARSPGTLVAAVLVLTLGLAQLASAARLAPIIGAFVAGLAMARSANVERVRRDVAPIGHLFVPVFFLQIGVETDVGRILRPSVLLLAVVLLAVAAAGKVASAIAAPHGSDRLLVGMGMLPRGEVGLIFAGLGLREGILGADLFAAILVVVLATTLAAPGLLATRLRSRRRDAAEQETPEPDGGWLQVIEGVVELRGTPPPALVAPLALRAARLMADASPGERILRWLGAQDGAPLQWPPSATAELIDLLRAGSARSWRFLETVGVLDGMLPEVADALRRRRADPYELDPARVLGFGTVERVHDVGRADDELVRDAVDNMVHPDRLLLAALMVDTAGEGMAAAEAARRMSRRLGLGPEAEADVSALVADGSLLAAAARRPSGLVPGRVAEIASHLGSADRTRASYLLSLALDGSSAAERPLVDELYRRVLDVVTRTAGSGGNGDDTLRSDARRLVSTAGAADRVFHAPRSLVHGSDAWTLARVATLVDPLPVRGRARVVVDHIDRARGRWRVDVVARDQPGLLARVTGVLADSGLGVATARAATWGDGGALESFEVLASAKPDVEALCTQIVTSFAAPLTSHAVPGALLGFDDVASPWHTVCRVDAPDRAGLLHDVAVAFAVTGVSVHSARIDTAAGRAVDEFELTGGTGGKLDAATKEAVAVALSTGTTAWRRRRGPSLLRRTHKS